MWLAVKCQEEIIFFKIYFPQKITFYGSRVWNRMEPRGKSFPVEGASKPAIVHKNGLILFGNDGKMVSFILQLFNS